MKPLLQKEDTYALRGLCMLLIIVHHTYLCAVEDSSCYTPEWLDAAGAGWTWGYAPTGIFLFLSGYGMFFSLLRNHPLHFSYLGNKLVKIIKPWLFLWAVSLLIYILTNEHLSMRLAYYFFTYGMPPDNEAWFLRVITALYVVSFIVFRYVHNSSSCVVIISAICLVYCFLGKASGLGPWWFVTVLNFPCGMFVALHYKRVCCISPIVIVAVCVPIIAILYIFQAFYIVSSLLFSITAVCFLRFINIRNRLLNYIGVNSILFYLLEEPAISHLSTFAKGNFFMYAAVSICITFILSTIYTYVMIKVASWRKMCHD